MFFKKIITKFEPELVGAIGALMMIVIFLSVIGLLPMIVAVPLFVTLVATLMLILYVGIKVEKSRKDVLEVKQQAIPVLTDVV